MQSSKAKLVALLAVCFLLPFGGCGKGLPEMGEVTGVLTMNGEPLPEVTIRFCPEPSETGTTPKTSSALTDEQGNFTLKYDDAGDVTGAAVGSHRVVLVDTMSENARDNPMPYRFSTNLVNVGATPLTQDVAPGTQNITIDISEYAP